MRNARLLITTNVMREMGLIDGSGKINQVAKSDIYFTALDQKRTYSERITAIIKLAKIYDATLYNHDLVRLTTAIAASVISSKEAERSVARIFSDLAKRFRFIGTYTLLEIRNLTGLQISRNDKDYVYLDFNARTD